MRAPEFAIIVGRAKTARKAIRFDIFIPTLYIQYSQRLKFNVRS